MASVTSNLPEIQAALRSLGGVLDLKKAHRSGTLGHQMADVIAAGVVARTLDRQQNPDGGTLTANVGRYGTRKRSRGIEVGVGLHGDEVGGEMLEFEQVRGMVAVGEDEMVMEHGLDADVKQLGQWFTEGNPSNNQPPRPFYELDPAIEAQVMDLAEEAAVERIRDLGR